MNLTIGKRKKILLAGAGIFLALGLLVLILKLAHFGGPAFFNFGKTELSSIESDSQGKFHDSGFFELKDAIIKNLEGAARLPAENSYFAQIGITSHHLPTAWSFISSFYKELERSAGPRRTFVIIGPDHLEKCRAPVTMTKISYWTPFGTLDIDQEMTGKILETGVSLEDGCFDGEHSIAVQAIFIKYFFPDAQIVPILLSASASDGSIRPLVEILADFKDRITVVVSADFSHYQTLERAKQLDSESEQMIKNLKVSLLDLEHVDSPPAVKFAVLLAEKLGATVPKILGRTNSYDFTGIAENTTGYLNVIFADKNSAAQASLLFLGDLMFDRNIRLAAQKNGNNFIFAPILPLLTASDVVVANLEGPITDNSSVSVNTVPGSNSNFVFTFDPSLATTLFDNNIRFISLGNNHILNFGQAGLEETKQYLTGAGVLYFAEPNGQRSIIKGIKGVKIGFVGYNQFVGNADGERVATIEEIKKLKAQADIIILYAHWGIEYAGAPNAVIRDLARQFVDAGADLVIGSHPHVIQPSEEYNGKKIYYSLGNFVFDQYFSEAVRQGLGVIVKIDAETKQLEFEETKLYLQNNGQTGIIKL